MSRVLADRAPGRPDEAELHEAVDQRPVVPLGGDPAAGDQVARVEPKVGKGGPDDGNGGRQIPMSTAAADAAVAVEMLAWQSAARGLHDDASRALGQVRVLTDRAGTTSVMTESYWWLADPQERSWPSGAAVAGDPQGAARCAVTITLST